MATRRFGRKAGDRAEVARWLGVFWLCGCRYSNVASYRCYFCGKRAPVEIRSLVADTLIAAEQAVADAPVPAGEPGGGFVGLLRGHLRPG